MEIAVLSDIHGNYIALERCVQYILSRKIKTFIFLGDYVGELAYPQKTMDIIYSLKENYQCHFVKGNKENYWLHYDNNWKEFDSTTGSLFYTYHNLTEKDLEFFKRLSCKEDISIDDFEPITICHGSPDKVNEKMLPDNENTFSIMDSNSNSLILCGHTHIQGSIEHNNKTVLNAGSVGVSLHAQGKAQFLILKGSDNEWEYEFISLDYDVDKVIDDLHASGLYQKAPSWCKVTEHLLRTGEISHGSVLAKAMSICQKEKGVCHWPDIPEHCWELAIEGMLPAANLEAYTKTEKSPL